MIILLFNIEVVVLTYFRDTGCFINYYYHYIIIIILLLLLWVVSRRFYIYIPFRCRVNNCRQRDDASKPQALVKIMAFRTSCMYLRAILVKSLPQCQLTCVCTACAEAMPGWRSSSSALSLCTCAEKVRKMCWRWDVQGHSALSGHGIGYVHHFWQ